MDRKSSLLVLVGIFLIITSTIELCYLLFLREEINLLEKQLHTLENKIADLNSELNEKMEKLNKTMLPLLKDSYNKTTSIEGLILKMETKSTVSIGEPIKVNLTLANFGPKPVALTFPSSKIFDLEIVDSSGRVVYRWSQGKFFLMVISRVVLEPGESKSTTITCECELPEGIYTILGIVEAYNVTLTCFSSLTIKA